MMDEKDDVSRTELRRQVQRLLGARGMAPRLRWHVVRFAAELLRAAERLDDSRRLLREAGVLLDGWWFVGPVPRGFVDLGGSPDRGAAHPAPAVPARWRKAAGEWPLGELPVGALVSPQEDGGGIAYASNMVWADRRTPVVPRAGRGQKVRVSVNGAVAGEGQAAELSPGWNRVLVETEAAGSERWLLSLRLEHPDGRPWVSPNARAARPVPAPDPRSFAAPPGRLSGRRGGRDLLHDWLDVRDPALAHDRARVLAFLGGESGMPQLVEAIDEAGSPEQLRDAARLAERSDEALEYLDRLLRAHPGDANARTERARRLHQRGQSLTALDEVRRAIRDAASDVPLTARVLEAEVLADIQALGTAQGLLEKVAQQHPDVPAVLSALASVQQRRQLPEMALRTYTRLARLENAEGETLYWQMEMARGLGRAGIAAEVGRRLTRLRPDVPGHAMLLARVAEDVGGAAEARELVARALRMFPRDPDVAASAGEFHLRQGEMARGTKLLRRALSLRPHQPDLRARIQFLDTESTDFAERYREDPAAAAARFPPSASGDPPKAEYLVSQRVTRLMPDGTVVTWWQDILRVGRAAPGTARTWTLAYDPSRQSASVMTARRLRPDGSVVEDAVVDDVELGDSWYGLYYEQRGTRVRFDGVAAGEVLVIERRLSDFGRSLYGGAYGDLTELQGEEPVRFARLVWIAPEEQAVHVTVRGAADIPVREARQDGSRTLTLQARDIPPLLPEPNMPGIAERGVVVHASTFADWNDVAAWYRKLVRPQLDPSPALVRQARELAGTAAGDLAKVRALHAFVAQKIRYVGLEFGEHGYKPYPVRDVLDRRFGDCKDKAALLQAMLAVVGVPCELVLVRTRSQGKVDARACSPAVFDHAIVRVPSVGLFVDPTARLNGLLELPAQDQGASALIVGEAGASLVTIPVSPAAENTLVRQQVVALSPGGGASPTRVQGELTARGLLAPDLREQLRVPATRKEQLQQMLNAEQPGIRVTGVASAGLDDILQPVEIRYTAELPPSMDGALRLLPAGFSLQRALAPTDHRAHDLLLAHPFTWEWRYVITVPAGARPKPPPAGRIGSPFGEVTAEVESRSLEELAVRLLVRLEPHRVPAADYPAFRSFLAHADNLLGAAARLEHAHAR